MILQVGAACYQGRTQGGGGGRHSLSDFERKPKRKRKRIERKDREVKKEVN